MTWRFEELEGREEKRNILPFPIPTPQQLSIREKSTQRSSGPGFPGLDGRSFPVTASLSSVRCSGCS
jgi:hypothetical protein